MLSFTPHVQAAQIKLDGSRERRLEINHRLVWHNNDRIGLSRLSSNEGASRREDNDACMLHIAPNFGSSKVDTGPDRRVINSQREQVGIRAQR